MRKGAPKRNGEAEREGERERAPERAEKARKLIPQLVKRGGFNFAEISLLFLRSRGQRLEAEDGKMEEVGMRERGREAGWLFVIGTGTEDEDEEEKEELREKRGNN